MDREITGKRPHFHREKAQTNPYRIMLWISLILAGLWLLFGIQRGRVEPLFEPTPTPTRTAGSFIQEAQAYFQTGKLDDPDPAAPAPPRYDAIDTYQRALQINPDDAQAWAEKARIETYSTTMLSNDPERLKRLEQALESINRAVELAPGGQHRARHPRLRAGLVCLQPPGFGRTPPGAAPGSRGRGSARLWAGPGERPGAGFLCRSAA